MTHQLKNPEVDWLVLYLNVQDTSTPMDFYLQLLDEFNTRSPKALGRLFAKGESLVKSALNSIEAIEYSSLKVAIRDSDAQLATRWRERLDDLLTRIRKDGLRVLVILDELPDMLLEMKRKDAAPVRDFLGWFREQRQNPTPADDAIRWLIGGSINLMATLDSMGLVDRMNDPEVVSLPVFSGEQVMEFVVTMLEDRGCGFDADVPEEVAKQLGRPIPYFLQMVTQELSRTWARTGVPLVRQDVVDVFNGVVASPEARDKLQHYHSRIARYYGDSATTAHALLDMLSLSENGISRRALQQKHDELAQTEAAELPLYENKKRFNELMLHLENDFYIVEADDDCFDFAGGVLKTWWRKYYA